MKVKIIFGLILFLVILLAIKFTNKPKTVTPQNEAKVIDQAIDNPLAISQMRAKSYPGSGITIEQKLGNGANYSQSIVSYKSEGLKIYALLTVPQGDPSASPQDDNRVFPVIVFNHGYIPPEQYRTNERYVAYVDGFARAGYIVLKPDFRGNGSSEGKPEGAYFSPAYTVDVLNALASIKKYPGVNPDKIGMWGHSMGGNITLRSMVISKDIKAGVIWAGVVGSYKSMFDIWFGRNNFQPSSREVAARRHLRQDFIDKYGRPNDNPKFWQAIDPTSFLSDISGPLQLHQGLADETVPVEFAKDLNDLMNQAKKPVKYYTYPGADHNFSGAAFSQAMQRSVEFFDKYLK